MAAQLTDYLYAERSGTGGKITVQDILDLSTTPAVYDSSTNVVDSDQQYSYTAWERIDGTAWFAQRWDSVTNTITTATGALPIPADIKTITYT